MLRGTATMRIGSFCESTPVRELIPQPSRATASSLGSVTTVRLVPDTAVMELSARTRLTMTSSVTSTEREPTPSRFFMSTWIGPETVLAIRVSWESSLLNSVMRVVM